MDRIGVVGCGLMGSGIAEIAARAGADVIVVERDAESLAAGEARIERSLTRAVSGGKMPEQEANTARGNLTFTENFERLADIEDRPSLLLDGAQRWLRRSQCYQLPPRLPFRPLHGSVQSYTRRLVPVR